MGVKMLAGIASAGTSESARVAAISLLFERGWGKAPQPIGDDEGNGIEIVIRQIIERRDVHVIDVQPERAEDKHDDAALK